MFRKVAIAAVLAVSSLAVAGAAQALTLTATERGAYVASTGGFGSGGSGSATGNYLTGIFSSDTYRSFYNFDLSGVGGSVTAATLTLSIDIAGGGGSTETVGIFDFGGDINDLVTDAGGFGAFADLGTGDQFGSAIVSTSLASGTVSISFNALGLAAINAALGGDFAVGGALTSLLGTSNQHLFGGTLDAPLTSLDLVVEAVPEPAALALVALGLVGLGFATRRRG